MAAAEFDPPAPAAGRPAVAMRGITKRFPGVLANDDVSFVVAPGEVHALLGENGAGKTTLMNILTGLYRPDQGEIEVGGRIVEFHNPRDAITAGIGMVHQHFRLVDTQVWKTFVSGVSRTVLDATECQNARGRRDRGGIAHAGRSGRQDLAASSASNSAWRS